MHALKGFLILLCLQTQILPVLGLSFTSIGSLDGGRNFKCNANVLLLCKAESKPVVMRIDSVQAVTCVKLCHLNPAALGNYTASYDFEKALIIIQINRTSLADSTRTFTCEGDLSSTSIQPYIKVFPEKSSTKLDITVSNNTNIVEIKVTTDCIVLPTNVTFIWNKTRTSNGSILEYLSDEEMIQSTAADNSYCIPADHCGGTGRSSTLKFNVETNGGIDYFITCTISVPQESIPENYRQNYTVISKQSFKLKAMVDTRASADKKDKTVEIAVPSVLVSIVLIVTIVLYCFIKKRRGN